MGNTNKEISASMPNFETFTHEYQENEKEIFVLMQGGISAVGHDTYWVTAAYFMACFDPETKQLYNGEGRLCWPITEEEKESGDFFQRFTNETIYRISVRSLVAPTALPNVRPSYNNRLYVTRILEENVSCAPLEEILDEYRKPVILHDNQLGTLTLRKEYSMFQGHIQWRGRKIEFFLDVDNGSKATWTKARNAMKKMLADQKQWDHNMRVFAARSLTSLANDWQQEEEQTHPITEKDFIKRITPESINMTSGGNFTAYYNDDDMFWGHSIEVSGTLRQGVQSADMVG